MEIDTYPPIGSTMVEGHVAWKHTQPAPFFKHAERNSRFLDAGPSSTEESGLEEGEYNPQPGRAQPQHQSGSTVRRASSSTLRTNLRTVRPNSASPPTPEAQVDGLPLTHVNAFDGMVDETLSTVQELTRERAQIQKKHGTKRPRSSEEAAFKVQRVNIDRREPLSSIRNHGVERGGGRTVTEAKDQRRTRGVGAPSRGHGDAGVDQDARPSANAREERIRVLPGHPVVTTGFNERQNPPLPRNTWPSQATPPGLAMPPPPVAFASQPHVQLTPPADDPPPRSCRGPAPTAAAGPSQPLMPPPRPVQTVGKKKALGMRPNRKGGSPTCSQPFKTPLLAKTAACAGGQTAAPVPPKLPTTRVSTAKSAAPITPEDTPPRVKPCEGGGGDEDEEMKDADSSINYSFDELDQETLLACSIYD